MSFGRVHLVSILAAAAILTSACGGEPPDKEMQQAQGAIDAARGARADRYAADELAAAEDALKRAHEAASQRDYRLALNNALDSRDRAQNSAKLAAVAIAAARVEASRALSGASALVTSAQNAVKQADPVRARGQLVAARQAIPDAEKRLQEARTHFDKGDFSEAMASAAAVTKALTTVVTDLEAPATPASRRRR